MFRKIFGKSSKSKKADKSAANASLGSEAIRKLRDTEDLFIKKQQFLEEQIKEQISIARSNGLKNKTGNIGVIWEFNA